MIERLKSNEDKIYRTESGEMMVVPALNVPQCISDKINELVDTVNKLETMAKNTNTVLESLVEENNIHEKQIDELQMKIEPKKCEITQNSTNNSENSHLFQGNEQKGHKIRSTNERLREALSLAENALIRLANDACCMDEHIYIDGILNQIEHITKGGKDE